MYLKPTYIPLLYKRRGNYYCCSEFSICPTECSMLFQCVIMTS